MHAGVRAEHGLEKRFGPDRTSGTALMRVRQVYKRAENGGTTLTNPYGVLGITHEGERLTCLLTQKAYDVSQQHLIQGNHFFVHLGPTTDTKGYFREEKSAVDYYTRVDHEDHMAYTNGSDAHPNKSFPEIPLIKGQLFTLAEIANLKDGAYVSTLGNLQDDGVLQTRTVKSTADNPHGETVHTYVVTVLAPKPLSEGQYIRVTFWGQSAIDANTQVAQIRQGGYTGPIVLLFVNGKKRCNTTSASEATSGITEANVNEYTPFYFITNNIEERLGDLKSYPPNQEYVALQDTYTPGQAKKIFKRWNMVHYESNTIITQTPTPGEQKKPANKAIQNSTVNPSGHTVDLTNATTAPSSPGKRTTPLPKTFANFEGMLGGSDQNAVGNEVVATPPRTSHDTGLHTPIGTPSTTSQQHTPASSPHGASSVPVVRGEDLNVKDVSKQAAKKVKGDQLFHVVQALKAQTETIKVLEHKLQRYEATLQRYEAAEIALSLPTESELPQLSEQQELEKIKLPSEYIAPTEANDTVRFELGEKTPTGKTHVLKAEVKQEPGLSTDVNQTEQRVEKSVEAFSFVPNCA